MTYNVSQSGITPVFVVLEQNTDDVIGFINFIIERGESADKTPFKGNKTKHNKASKKPKKDSIWNYI